MTLRNRAKMTVGAGLALAVYGLVEAPLVMSVSMPLVSPVLVVVVAAFYTLCVAAPGERSGFGVTLPLWRLPGWALAVWALFLVAPCVSLLFWTPSGSRQNYEPTPLFSLVAAYFGVTLALMSWERLRGLAPEQRPTP
ncbi:hypothetical protein F4553_000857 [Allocatelliglobosispora scoriae]|uniref:Uncharacterized protein n=1 Tax=Allocatelliglobosispora scoriae TaxID=643052 RepID=A0A841BJH0_9ACTN|nr:hypothetical protein [Allocatelliglobosispora scoriae]MBB5867478.1 hypothetical protein [Allocatelliglobosispora scoriae]